MQTIMKTIINKISIILLVTLTMACVEESLDPVKFAEVKKATMLALRGTAFNNLSSSGCVNSFFKDNIIGNEVFSYEADYLSEDQESLQEVQLFASIITSQKLRPRARKLVATVPGSAFSFPSGSTIKRGTISATLTTIIAALDIPDDSVKSKLGAGDITMDVDLVLKDGSKILASAIVNPNLFQSVIFYPAMVLTYCANATEDFLPVASTKMLGEFSYNATTKVITRTVVPLKNAVKDTLYIEYDQPEMKVTPTVSFSPAGAGSGGAVTPYKDKENAFYVIYTPNATYTGAVTATVSGGVATIAGVDLTQDDKKQAINVDNTSPVVTKVSTGTRIGAGQFVTIKVTVHEKLSRKAANVIKVTIDGTALGLEKVTDAKMIVADDQLSASLIYVFKPAVPGGTATHGDMVVDFTTQAIDEAGNGVNITDGSLTVDVGIPPAPSLTLAGTYDFGTTIRWSATQGVNAGSNPNGSMTGKVYFIAITTGKPKPTGFSVDLDGIATWVMPADPASTTTPKAKVSIRQSGTIAVDEGGSGTVFTPFTANGVGTTGFDIYAVFVSSSGTISAIPTAPQLGASILPTPIPVDMAF